MSGKKQIMVDESAWRDAMRAAGRLRDVQRELPGMIAAVQQAHQQQAARDRAALQARQDQLSQRLAGLSEQARQLEASTSRRISAAAATIMNEAREANRQLRGEARQLLAAQEQRFDAALSAERTERQQEAGTLRTELERQRAELAEQRDIRASVLRAAQTAAADARVLHDAIAASLPHERFAPGRLPRLTSRLENAERSAAAGTGETALAQAQELQLALGELRAEVELRDAEWRAAHLTAVGAVTALAEQISYNSMITIPDEDSSAEVVLDVDFWSDGELSVIWRQADELAARLAAEASPPSLAELRDISEVRVADLDKRLSEVVAAARARQWAAQLRVNMAEMVVGVLESVTAYAWDGDATFAGGDQREAFYTKLIHPDESEIVVEVAPDQRGESCVVRVLSYETGRPDESLRLERVRAIADTMLERGLGGTSAVEPGEPDPRLRDFPRLQQPRAQATAERN